jgi:acyl-CoA reductase-like NAD-dependent aldehyde dehydrogenase
MSTDRVIVQRGISEALITALKAIALKIHANTEPGGHIGPLIPPSSAERVVSLLTDAHARGAEVLVGDLSHRDAILQPHILLGVEPGWPLWEKESFGPVFAIKVADTEDELIELANQTDYSLMGALWTRDLDKGLKLARRVRVGEFPFFLGASLAGTWRVLTNMCG